MNEPRRMIEESESEFERSLLGAGTAYELAPDVRQKTLSALGLLGVAAVPVAAAASTSASMAPPAASASLLAKLGWIKVLGIAALGTAVVVPAGYLLSQRGAPQEQPAKPAVAAPANVAAPAATPASPDEAREPAELPPAETAVAKSSAKPERFESKPADSSAALRAELSSLDAARAMLASGNPSGALSALDAYDRANPRGRLKLEAEVLRIDALAGSGRRDAAKKRAEAFLAKYPNSVLASRVRRYTKP